MKKGPFTLLCFSTVVFAQLCIAQTPQHRIDSVLAVLKTAKEDTNKVIMLNRLSVSFLRNDAFEKARIYANEALELSGKINYRKGAVNADINVGDIYFDQGNYEDALKTYLVALKIAQEIGYKKGIASSCNELGGAYQSQGNYTEALKYLLEALKIEEEIGDKKAIAEAFDNIGNVEGLLGNNDEELKNHFASLKIRKEIGDKEGMAISYINIGTVYDAEKKFDEALKNYFAGLKIGEELGNKYLTYVVHNNIGLIYMEQGKYTDALNNELAALKTINEMGSKQGMASVYLSIGSTYTKLKKYAPAKEYLHNGLSLAKEMRLKESIKNGYANLADLDSSMGNYLQAYVDFRMYDIYKDSLLNETIGKQTSEMKAKYESEKKEKEIALLTKDKEIQNAAIKKQKLLRNSFIAGFVLLLTLSLFAFNNFRVRNRLRLESMRNKIAGDLHDDIGSTLNSISVYSEVAKQKSPVVVHELEEIGNASRKIIDTMSDIVWTINAKNDSFEQIILRLRSLAYNLLRAKNIEHVFKADEHLNELKLSMEERRNFYLIFKEALNNLIKYSNASQANISITHSNHLIVLSIRDNGTGFNPTQVHNGNGLMNMRNRAAEMNAELKIESGRGEGTNIELKMKV